MNDEKWCAAQAPKYTESSLQSKLNDVIPKAPDHSLLVYSTETDFSGKRFNVFDANSSRIINVSEELLRRVVSRMIPPIQVLKKRESKFAIFMNEQLAGVADKRIGAKRFSDRVKKD
ncbi:MAG: hypothetical protein WAV41_05110 [Microgenomates group bacterium]